MLTKEIKVDLNKRYTMLKEWKTYNKDYSSYQSYIQVFNTILIKNPRKNILQL